MSTVYLSVSIGSKPAMRSESESASEAEALLALKGKRVIIVDDEGITQLQLRKTLSRIGLTVVGSAATGHEAVEVCLRERPDLILMDINMPGEINGLEAARRILAQYSACIVMLTAYAQHEAEARELGVYGYILKPVDTARLIPQLREALRRFNQQSYPLTA